MSEERKPLWLWTAALLTGMPALYVASFGPACAFVELDVLPPSVLRTGFFRPCLALAIDGPTPVRTLISAWMKCCGGAYVFSELVARIEFEDAPYLGVAGGLYP